MARISDNAINLALLDESAGEIMAESEDDNSGKKIAVVGAGLLLAFFLFRGGKSGAPSGKAGRAIIKFDREGITINGKRGSIDDAISEAKRSGEAEIRTTGSAVLKDLRDGADRLERSGIVLFADSTVEELLR
jgi:hypothetical protein